MSIPDEAAEQYRFVQRLQVVTVAAGRRAWARMGPDFDASWARVAPQVTQVTAAAQLASARRASGGFPRVLDELGIVDPALAEVDVRPLAGVAADGRPLAGLLAGAVGRAKQVSRDHVRVYDYENIDARGARSTVRVREFIPGAPPAVALQAGGRWLDTLIRLSVTDAARSATQAETVVRERVGWVRQVNPPCCPACANLAGRWYSWQAGFDRHPGCDCLAIPSTENVAGDLTTSPQRLLDGGQVQGLTASQRKRLAAGEDRTRVLNEGRDLWRARVQEQRRAARKAAAGDPSPVPQGVSMERLLDSVNRETARAAMARQGLIR